MKGKQHHLSSKEWCYITVSMWQCFRMAPLLIYIWLHHTFLVLFFFFCLVEESKHNGIKQTYVWNFKARNLVVLEKKPSVLSKTHNVKWRMPLESILVMGLTYKLASWWDIGSSCICLFDSFLSHLYWAQTTAPYLQNKWVKLARKTGITEAGDQHSHHYVAHVVKAASAAIKN